MARNVRDIMTAAPTAVDAQDSVASVARMMRDQDIDVVLVMNEGDLMGLVSDRDLVVGAVAEGADPQETTMGRAVRTDLITVDADEDIDHAATTMREHAARRVAVLDAGEPVGLVCLDDPDMGASSAPPVAPTPAQGRQQRGAD